MKENLSICLAGDLFLGSPVSLNQIQNIRGLCKGKDLTILNLEGACYSSTPQKKAALLSLNESIFGELKGFVVSLANNHVTDYGASGLNLLQKRLDDAGVEYFGLVDNVGDRNEISIIERNGWRICLVGLGWTNEQCCEPTEFSAGVRALTYDDIKATFGRLNKLSYDFLIFYLHCGYEFETYPLPLHVDQTRLLIDLGADMVFGSHSHCVQKWEKYKGKYIFHGLGNFLFCPGADNFPKICDFGLIVDFELKSSTKTADAVKGRIIRYDRQSHQYHIFEEADKLESLKLDVPDLQVYTQNYKRLRTRKRNPRPVLKPQANITNSIKYNLWHFVVFLTGVLGIRQMVKRMLNWEKFDE